MVAQIIKTSPHNNFVLTQVCENIVICEASNDPHNWGNATDKDPAFLVYLGCQKDEVKGYVQTLNNLYDCEWCEVRKPKYLKGFESELKIKGMNRYALKFLVKAETKNIVKFDLSDEILEAAKFLKEEQELLGETEAIALILSNWVEEQLSEIVWHYQRNQSLQKEIFQVELKAEKSLIN